MSKRGHCRPIHWKWAAVHQWSVQYLQLAGQHYTPLRKMALWKMATNLIMEAEAACTKVTSGACWLLRHCLDECGHIVKYWCFEWVVWLSGDPWNPLVFDYVKNTFCTLTFLCWNQVTFQLWNICKNIFICLVNETREMMIAQMMRCLLWENNCTSVSKKFRGWGWHPVAQHHYLALPHFYIYYITSHLIHIHRYRWYPLKGAHSWQASSTSGLWPYMKHTRWKVELLVYCESTSIKEHTHRYKLAKVLH